jgi:hypothetical protein
MYNEGPCYLCGKSQWDCQCCTGCERSIYDCVCKDQETMTDTEIIAALPVGITSSRQELRDYATAHGVAFDEQDAWNVLLRKIEKDAIAKAKEQEVSV